MKREYPATRKENVMDEIHGVKIEDPYRWLEDASSAEVQEWVEEQNELALSVLGEYQGEETLKKRLLALYNYDYIMVSYFNVVNTGRGPRFFYYFREVGKNQPSLCYQDGINGERVILFDPLEMSEDATVAVDWFYPSKDGSMIAFGVSEGGTEKSVLHVMRVDAKETLPDKIPQTKWCSLVWLDNDGFYYSRYPLPGTVSEEDENYHHHAYYHRLGADYKDDVKVFGEGRPKTEHQAPFISDDGSLLGMLSYRYTSSDIFVARVNRENPSVLRFVPVIESDSAISNPYFSGNQLLVNTQIDAPNGQILRFDLSKFSEDDKVPPGLTLVKEGNGVIFDVIYLRFAAFDGRLAVIEDKNASSKLKLYDFDSGELLEEVDFGTHVTIYEVFSAPGLDTLFYSRGSFFYPASHHVYKEDTHQVLYEPELDINVSEFHSDLVWYESKDGTKVSMFLLSKAGQKFTKMTPVTLTGYGGFGVSETPNYRPDFVAWVEQGGVIGVPHLRGGGEYGHEWHRAGNRENKQNVFDDFISAAEWFIAEGIGSQETIAIQGGSNGGLLVGAAMVQKPDLFGAVACAVPLLDMIRYTNFQVAKIWAPEYGDPSVKEEFEWLYSYSPYHHVKKTDYPATFLYTALGDTRVDPMHAFKMAAKLQDVVGTFEEVRPVILHTESQVGHGVGTSIEKQIELSVKSLLFRARHTGLDILD
ncbi:MAG: prolyl oligopeptidase family protein [Candidatus Hodarchaeota archaeon]